ncbi:TPA: SAM-dependent methyltransferase, partial [Campylobacter jejuni]
DPKKSLPEFNRILTGGGYFTAIWNPRHIVEGSVFDEIEKEIKHIVPDLARVSSGTQNVKKWEEILVSTGDFTDCFFMECDYKEFWDKERYLGAWHSVNDIQAQAGEKRWKEILEMIEAKISHMQSIEIPYKIRAWTARKA